MPANISEFLFGDRCMGTRLEVSILCSHEHHAKTIWNEILAFCHHAERVFSRFDEYSELSKINRGESIIVSEIFEKVLIKAQKGFEYTNGTFNPLCSPYFFGYTNDFEHNKFSKSKPIQNIFFDQIHWEKENHTITLPSGAYIDLGGLVKGWCAETVARKYAPQVHGIIVNLGGDMSAFGNDMLSETFQVSIWNPITKQEISLEIQNEVLCTSGTYKRYWRNHHHIIDPFILSSAQSDLVSASIVHEDGGICESLATACIIWGREKSVSFLEQEKIRYVLIEKSGTVWRNI